MKNTPADNKTKPSLSESFVLGGDGVTIPLDKTSPNEKVRLGFLFLVYDMVSCHRSFLPEDREGDISAFLKI